MIFKQRKTNRKKVRYPDISWAYLNGFDLYEMLRVPEETLQACLVAYIREKYPNALFLGNVASGVELGWEKAARQKKQGNCADWPDIFIADKRGNYSGCFIELKKEGTKITTKKDEPASEHIGNQLKFLNRLAHQGYHAFMAVGWVQAKGVVDWYFSLPDASHPDKLFIYETFNKEKHVQE